MMKNTVPSKEEFLATKKHFIKCMKDLFDQNYSINSSKLNELVARSHYNFDNGYQSLVADWKKENKGNEAGGNSFVERCRSKPSYAEIDRKYLGVLDKFNNKLDELYYFAKVDDGDDDICLWLYKGYIEVTSEIIRLSDPIGEPAAFTMKEFNESNLFEKRAMSLEMEFLNKYYDVEWIMAGDGTSCKFSEKKLGDRDVVRFCDNSRSNYKSLVGSTGLNGLCDKTRVLLTKKDNNKMFGEGYWYSAVFVFKMKKKFLA